LGIESGITELRRRKRPIHFESQPWAPWVAIAGEGVQFNKNLSRSFRRTLRRIRKRAEAAGKIRFDAITESSRLDELLEIFFDIEYRGWKGRAGTAIRCHEATAVFYKEIADWAMRRGGLFLFLLNLSDKPAAASLCLRSGKTVFQLKAGFDESFAAMSPGKILHQEIIMYLYGSSGISVFDLQGECDPWKMEWTKRISKKGKITIYPHSLSGWGRYALESGWKDLLKKSKTANKLKAWLNKSKNETRHVR